MSSRESRRRAGVRRARWTAGATMVVTGASAAAGFGQMPDPAQILLLLGACAVSGWLAYQGAVLAGVGGGKKNTPYGKTIWQLPIVPAS